MNSTYGPIVNQLITGSPMLIVYLIALVMALVYRDRYPKPANLMLIAAILLLAVTIGTILFQNWIFQMTMGATRMSMQRYSTILGVVFIISNLLRAGGFVLLLVAVFAGRDSQDVRGFQVMPPPPGGGFH
jgi:hypothetical protein